eukprot:Gb_17085 [translate_table: standard]
MTIPHARLWERGGSSREVEERVSRAHGGEPGKGRPREGGRASRTRGQATTGGEQARRERGRGRHGQQWKRRAETEGNREDAGEVQRPTEGDGEGRTGETRNRVERSRRRQLYR